MMDEYITRDAACRAFYNDRTLSGYEKAYCNEIIKNIPTANVTPIRHGYWVDGDPICPVCGKDKFEGLDADIWADWKPLYCPNCGAKMDLQCKE